MILTCQKCSTSFKLDETLLKATGSKVRCSLCQNIWVAFLPEKPSDVIDAPAEDGTGLGGAALAATGAVVGAAMAGSAQEATDEAEVPADRPPELKFFADSEFEDDQSDDDDLVTDEINLDELDQLLSEESDSPAPPQADEDFKTEELNLADLEKMLDIESDQVKPDTAEAQPEPDDLDLGEALTDFPQTENVEKEDSVIEELDLDLEDLENLLEEDTGLGDEIAAMEESTGGIGEPAEALDLDLDDAGAADIELDMAPELEDLLEDDGDEPVVDETADIEMPDAADFLDASERPPDADVGQDQELDLELAPGLDGIFDEGEDQDVVLEETEELDFSELGADLAQAAEEPQGDGAQDAELELDLEPEADQAFDEGAFEEAPPALDLSDLTASLDGEDAEAPSGGEDILEPELELDLDAGESGDAEELVLEMDDTDQAGAPGAIVEETRELDVDELEALLEGAGEVSGADEEASSDSLELDIDLDGLDGGEDELEDATRELDLDDIEKILEMDSAGGESEPPVEDASEELDLDLDMDDVALPAPDIEETGEETTGTGSELDLSDLEKMLDVEDTTDTPDVLEEDMEDLDLDFDLQPSTEESEDLDLEFDMLDEEPKEASALFDTSESEDLGLDLNLGGPEGADAGDLEGDLDFEIMDDDLAVEEVDLDLAAEDIGAETLAEPVGGGAVGQVGKPAERDLTQELMDEMAAADTQTMAAPPVQPKPIKPVPPPKKTKKKSSKSLVLLFILVLLGAAGYLLPKYTDIKIPGIKMPDLSGIPYIGEFFGSQAPEAIVPVEATLQGDWIQNQQAGRLYAIRGRVKNEYASARSYIRVTGRVYANGRQFQRAAKAYCGNVLTPEELATLALADIQKRLSNRSGANNSNVKVASGKEVPFLVVFGDLPPDVELQEFAVEISGSLPVASSK